MNGCDVIVANHAEFNRRSMWGYSAPERAAWDRGGGALQDQALFWGRGDSLVLLSAEPGQAFLEEVRRAQGGRRVEVLAVPGDGVFLCRDAAASAEVIDLVADRLSGGGRLLSWGVTRGFYSLADRLAQSGCIFDVPETPSRDYFSRALWLDSKVGARLFLGSHGLPLPEGRLAVDGAEAAQAALWFAARGSGAVVKANFAAGGFGVRVFSVEEVLSRPGIVEADLAARGRYDGCWRSGLFVVEELVGGECWRESLSLTTDWLVLPDGGVQLMGSGVMTMSRRSHYEGVTAGVGAISEPLRLRCESLGADIAGALSKAGYRGWFDADMVASPDGGVFVNEINLRRSCPAYAMELARRRWGDPWESVGCVATHDRVYMGRQRPGGYGPLREVVDRFNIEGEPKGLFAVVSGVTTSLDLPVPFVGVAVLGPESGAVRAGLSKLKELLRAGGAGR